MALRIPFRKLTHEGLSVDIEVFRGFSILFLGKDVRSEQSRPIQILGIAGREVNTSSLVWYYEYEPLPASISRPLLVQQLEQRGFRVGVFDQFGNFQSKVA